MRCHRLTPLASEPSEPCELVLWRGGSAGRQPNTIKVNVRVFTRRLANGAPVGLLLMQDDPACGADLKARTSIDREVVELRATVDLRDEELAALEHEIWQQREVRFYIYTSDPNRRERSMRTEPPEPNRPNRGALGGVGRWGVWRRPGCECGAFGGAWAHHPHRSSPPEKELVGLYARLGVTPIEQPKSVGGGIKGKGVPKDEKIRVSFGKANKVTDYSKGSSPAEFGNKVRHDALRMRVNGTSDEMKMKP